MAESLSRTMTILSKILLNLQSSGLKEVQIRFEDFGFQLKAAGPEGKPPMLNVSYEMSEQGEHISMITCP